MKKFFKSNVKVAFKVIDKFIAKQDAVKLSFTIIKKKAVPSKVWLNVNN